MSKSIPKYFWLGGLEAKHDARYRIPARQVAPKVLEVYACKQWWKMHLAGFAGGCGEITRKDFRALIKQSDKFDPQIRPLIWIFHNTARFNADGGAGIEEIERVSEQMRLRCAAGESSGYWVYRRLPAELRAWKRWLKARAPAYYRQLVAENRTAARKLRKLLSERQRSAFKCPHQNPCGVAAKPQLTRRLRALVS